jgi:hypothetical protein
MANGRMQMAKMTAGVAQCECLVDFQIDAGPAYAFAYANAAEE